jgi:hypothetical protein
VMTLPPPGGAPKRQARLPAIEFSDQVDYDGMWSLLDNRTVDIHLVTGRVIEAVTVNYGAMKSWLRLESVEDGSAVREFATADDSDFFADQIERIVYL